MNKPIRLTGIDLCRGLAAFAVILVHSGDETWGIPITEQAIQFRYLFYFAVPFFLAASFYFATKKLPANISVSFWQKKINRIIVPYLLWSLVYLIFKFMIFFITNNTKQIQQLLSDPLAIVFFGAASYHLYFLPLLISGTWLLYFVNYFQQKQNSLALLSLFSILSLIVYHLLLISNNSFDLGSYTAFPGLLNLFPADSLSYYVARVVLVNIAWIVRCLPYFFIAILVNQVLDKVNCQIFYQQQTTILIFLIFLCINLVGKNFLPNAVKCINLVGKNFLPNAVNEIAIAFLLLLFGISSSAQIKHNALSVNLGLCSFGIYLIHPFVKSFIEIILNRFLPQLTQNVSIISMLTYSILSFLVSWISFILKNKLFSQYI